MSKLTKLKRCRECGVLLQNTSPNYPGFQSESTIKSKEDYCLCDSCFETKLRIDEQENEIDKGYFKILEKIREDNALVVYVLDLFSFEESFNDKIVDSLRGCDVLAVGNKFDLMPQNTKEKDLINYVTYRLEIANLPIKDVAITSTKTNFNIELLYRKIKELSNNRDVYFIGGSVSGKSALIQAFLKRFNNETDEPIVTHTFANTDLRGFKIPLGDGYYLYETPGLQINNSIMAKVEYVIAKKIEPTSTVKPQTFKISSGYSILFGGLAMIEMIKGPSQKIEVYCRDTIEVKTSKKGENVVSNSILKSNLKPSSNLLKTYSAFDAYDVIIQDEGYNDIGILGLGWIKFKAKNQIFRVFVPKGVSVFTTRSKILNAIK